MTTKTAYRFRVIVFVVFMLLVTSSSSAPLRISVSPISGRSYKELVEEAYKLGATKEELLILCRGFTPCKEEVLNV